MPELGIRNQCFFIAVYASIILLCAATMTSQQTGSLTGTVTTRATFVRRARRRG